MSTPDPRALALVHRTHVELGMDGYGTTCSCSGPAQTFSKRSEALIFERAHLIQAGIDSMVHSNDAWKALLEERNTWARQIADVRDDLDSMRAERDQALTAKAEAETERDLLVAELAEYRAERVIASVGGVA